MTKKLLTALLTLMLALSGCAGFDVKYLDRGEPLKAPDEAALVYGKIIIVENGKPTAPYSMRFPLLTLFHVESGKKSGRLAVESDGSFYWVVPRGTYIITAITYHDAWHGSIGSYVFQPQAVFQTPFGADAFYPGTLIIDVDVGRRLLGEYYLEKVTGVRVEDEFDAAKGSILNRNPELLARMEKNLMIHSKSIPIDPELQKKKALSDLLGTIGMVLLIQLNLSY